MRLCLLFNSFKALKRTITKSPVHLPDRFSHLIKDRKAVYVFSLNFSSEIQVLSLSVSLFLLPAQTFRHASCYHTWCEHWGLGGSHPPVPCSRRACGVPLPLAKQPCRWTQMFSALCFYPLNSQQQRVSLLKIILPCLFRKWSRNVTIHFIRPLDRHEQGYQKTTLQVKKLSKQSTTSSCTFRVITEEKTCLKQKLLSQRHQNF